MISSFVLLGSPENAGSIQTDRILESRVPGERESMMNSILSLNSWASCSGPMDVSRRTCNSSRNLVRLGQFLEDLRTRVFDGDLSELSGEILVFMGVVGIVFGRNSLNELRKLTVIHIPQAAKASQHFSVAGLRPHD